MIRIHFLAITLLWSTSIWAQTNRAVIRDLRGEWQRDTTKGELSRAVYLSIDPTADRGTYMQVESIRPHIVWCGGKRIGRFDRFSSMSVDSLAGIYGAPLQVAVYTDQGTQFLKTMLVRFFPEPVEEPLRLREKSYFLDFTIVAVLLLAILFLVIMHSNPGLLFDYFNVTKLLSLQERDETLAAGRLGSSINLLIYLFVGMWLSLLIMVIFHFAPSEWVRAQQLSFESLSDGLLHWLTLSATIVGALFLKVLLTSLATNLFKFRDGYTVHVLNFFRQVAFLSVLLSIVILIYFMAGTREPVFYQTLVRILAWSLSLWVVLIFFKLMTKAPFSGFHLFSYLCATEIFPLFVFFQILFF